MAQLNAVTADCKISRNQQLLSTEVGGELVLMSIEAGKYYGLNKIASDIWKRIGTEAEVQALCDDVVASYQGQPETITSDVLQLLTQMQHHGLLQVSA